MSIPTYVRVSARNGIVRKFDKDGVRLQIRPLSIQQLFSSNKSQHPVAAHVTDVAALYILLIEKILEREPIPSDEVGFYFGNAFKTSWWNIMSGISQALHARGLVKNSEPQVWTSYETAADELDWPRAYIRGMGASR